MLSNYNQYFDQNSGAHTTHRTKLPLYSYEMNINIHTNSCYNIVDTRSRGRGYVTHQQQ